MKISVSPSLLILAGSILWGTGGVFILTAAHYGSTPELTGFLRILFSFLILLPVCLFRSGLRSLSLSPRSLLVCALLGILCQGLYNIFYNEAVTRIGMTGSAVLLNLAPFVAASASFLLFGERQTVRKTAAILSCTAGCFLTVTGGVFSPSELPLTGILFGIGAGVSYGMTSVLGKLAGKSCDVFAMSLWSYFFAALFLFFRCDPLAEADLLTAPVLLTGFLFALIPTVIAYLLYYEGVVRLEENSRVPVLASAETITAAVIGILFFGDPMDPVRFLGIVLTAGSALAMAGQSCFPDPIKKRLR